MPGVPSFIATGPWWGIFGFLLVLVFCRAQGTYWLGRSLRRGVAGPSLPDAEASAVRQPSQRRAKLAARFSGPAWNRAQAFLDRWGVLAVPVSFATVGFHTLVIAAAGFGRMRWDLFTVAMLPGCVAWATFYGLVGLGLVEAWARSPWLFVAVVAAAAALAWGLAALRRTRTADSAARTPR